MKTITKTIAGIFGMMMLLTVQNVNAQTYYGYISAKEKSESTASDKVNRLIVSNVFEVKFCRSSQVSFYNINTGGGTASQYKPLLKTSTITATNYAVITSTSIMQMYNFFNRLTKPKEIVKTPLQNTKTIRTIRYIIR